MWIYRGKKVYIFGDETKIFNCPSVLWLLPHGYVPDNLGTVVKKKKKNPGGIVATSPAIKWALEILGHSEGKKKKQQPTQSEEEKEA